MNSPLNQSPNQNQYFPSILNWEEEQRNSSQPAHLSTNEEPMSPLFRGCGGSSLFNDNQLFPPYDQQHENSLIFNSNEEASEPQITRKNSLQFSNMTRNFYQISDAEYHSQQLYRMAEKEGMPEFLFHPDIPYGTLTKEQIENANFPEDNELSLEQFRNGYPPEYYDITALSKDKFQMMRNAQEEKKQEVEEVEEVKEFEGTIQSGNNNLNLEISEEGVVSTEPFSQVFDNLTVDQSQIPQPTSAKGRKAKNKRLSKKTKDQQDSKTCSKKRNVNLRKRNYTEFKEIMESETKSRQYTLTKTTKIYDINQDLRALQNPSLSKEQRSKIRNRISAQKSRDRKKQEYGSLRFAIGMIEEQNENLKKELKKKEQAMKKLQRQMRKQLCKKCKRIQFDFGDELSTEDEDDNISTEPSISHKGKSSTKSKSVPRNTGFTLMRRSAGSALTGGLFAAFIGIICMIGIFMNTSSSGAGGAQRLLNTYEQNAQNFQEMAYQSPGNDSTSSALIELQKIQMNYTGEQIQQNSNALVELLENNAEQFIQLGKKFLDDEKYNTKERSKEEILNMLKANKIQFENGLIKSILQQQEAQKKPKESKGFLKSKPQTTSLKQKFNYTWEQQCLAQKIEQHKKEAQTKLASYGNEIALLTEDREAIDPSISSIYCSKPVMQPAQIYLKEDGCNYIHLMIPSSEISIIPSHSSPLLNNKALDETDYMLQIGCKVFEVNKIKMKQDSLN